MKVVMVKVVLGWFDQTTIFRTCCRLASKKVVGLKIVFGGTWLD